MEEAKGVHSLRAIEEEIQQRWKQEHTYEKVVAKNSQRPKFYFCDGPPYATGEIHPGTAWNKCIKDAICRYKRFRGYNVRAQPGYDTHGLPIEHKVELQLKIQNKKEIETYGVERFVEECKKFATKYIDVMTNQFESLGVWMDFNRPYITYTDEFIEKSWTTIKRAWEKGLLTQGVYVIPICSRCETTMANYELEYEEKEDPSIYIKFKVVDEENTYLLVWTTTPWTLLANRAVMVNPNFTYVKADVEGERWIVAKERVEQLQSIVGKDFIILEEISGKELEGKRYTHVIESERTCPIVLSERFVTLEDGTGLVHCAPGHGPEDYQVGKEYGLEIYCPVDFQGKYTEGPWKALHVKEADPLIIQTLEDDGRIVAHKKIRHRYPHCWRCKTPLIFITSQQWFIAISKIREEMLTQIRATRWVPEFARTWFTDFVSGAPEWCISRQRYWGIPLPIWKCASCNHITVIGSRKELPRAVRELHRPYIDEITFTCPSCSGTMYRVPDVLDVWFDSGNAIWASLSDEEEATWGNADFIVEGKDQIRGWFYSLLGSGIIRNGACPYRTVLMHGFFVDEKGEKMSKSLGNFVPLSQILSKTSADTFRLWSLGSVIWEDLRFHWDELSEAQGVLMTLLNLHTFGNRFLPSSLPPMPEKLEEEDRWFLSELETLKRDVTAHFEAYEIHLAVKKLRFFIVETWSRFFMKVVKKRLAEERNTAAVYALFAKALDDVTIMMAPITPFLADKIYRERHGQSVFFAPWVSVNEKNIDRDGATQMAIVQEIVNVASRIRQKAGIKLRWPLRTLVVETKDNKVKEAVDRFFYVIMALTNVKQVSINSSRPSQHASEEWSGGTIVLDIDITEEIFHEAMVREVARRIQHMRKEKGLEERDEIVVHLYADEKLRAILTKKEDALKEQVHARTVVFEEKKPYMTSWDIEGMNAAASIEKV